MRNTQTFTCPDCGMTSFNPNDVKYKYCGKCHTFPEQRAFKQESMHPTVSDMLHDPLKLKVWKMQEWAKSMRKLIKELP